jgi:hypothetical protein
MLAAIYGRCVRDIQKARSETGAASAGVQGRRRGASVAADLQQEIDSLAQEIDAILLNSVIGPVLRPFELAAGQLAQIQDRLKTIAG